MLIVTLGEPSGISYEIFLKTFWEIEKLFKKEKKVYIGSKLHLKRILFSRYSKKYSLFQRYKILKKIKNIKLYPKFIFGKDIYINGKITYFTLKEAIKYLKFRKIRSKRKNIENILKKRYILFTLPISKKNIPKKDFIGHTEYFGKKFSTEPIMLMGNKKFLFAFFTTHLPLKEVSNYIKKDRIVNFLKNLVNNFPNVKKIGVCAFNPHAGENGKLGKEEIKEILPAIKKVKKDFKHIDIFLKPADTIFFEKADLYVNMYHDQALIVLKLTDKKSIFNLTLNLPFLRISPGHGTAYDIAGKGICEVDASLEALKLIKRGRSNA